MSSVYPMILSGQRMTADVYTGMETITAWKSANTGITSSTTLTSDADLVVALAANGTYEIELQVLYNGLSAANIKTAWLPPTGVSGNRWCLGPGSTSTGTLANNITMQAGVYPIATAVTYSCAANSASAQQGLFERAIIVMGSSAGTMTLQWAQATSSTTAVTVCAGSIMTARRLA